MTECIICYEKNNIGCLLCGHLICYECLNENNKINGKKCPNCRQKSELWIKIFISDEEEKEIKKEIEKLITQLNYSSTNFIEILNKKKEAKAKYLIIKSKISELKKEIIDQAELELIETKNNINKNKEIIGKQLNEIEENIKNYENFKKIIIKQNKKIEEIKILFEKFNKIEF